MPSGAASPLTSSPSGPRSCAAEAAAGHASAQIAVANAAPERRRQPITDRRIRARPRLGLRTMSSSSHGPPRAAALPTERRTSKIWALVIEVKHKTRQSHEINHQIPSEHLGLSPRGDAPDELGCRRRFTDQRRLRGRPPLRGASGRAPRNHVARNRSVASVSQVERPTTGMDDEQALGGARSDAGPLLYP